MNVLFVARTDWTNFGYNFSEALNSVGITSHSAYQKENVIGPKGIHFNKYDKIKGLVEEADVVIINHTKSPIGMTQIEDDILKKDKKLLVLHGGSNYRQNSNRFNSEYNNIVHATLTFYDLRNKGAKNEKLLMVPVDTNFLQPIYHRRDKLIVANYPTQYATRPLAKGRDIVVKAMKELNDGSFIFKGETNVIPWNEHIDRIRDCDIYIESINTDQKGIPLTAYGVVGAEAAALGKIVIGKFFHYKDVERDFAPCKCKIRHAYDGESLKEVMTYLLSLSKEEIFELQKESREWAINCHSYKAVGTRLKNIIEGLYADKESS